MASVAPWSWAAVRNDTLWICWQADVACFAPLQWNVADDDGLAPGIRMADPWWLAFVNDRTLILHRSDRTWIVGRDRVPTPDAEASPARLQLPRIMPCAIGGWWPADTGTGVGWVERGCGAPCRPRATPRARRPRAWRWTASFELGVYRTRNAPPQGPSRGGENRSVVWSVVLSGRFDPLAQHRSTSLLPRPTPRVPRTETGPWAMEERRAVMTVVCRGPS